MKKLVRIFALVLTLALLLSTVPMAVAASPLAKFEVIPEDGVDIECVVGDESITSLTYKNSGIKAGKEYAIFVVALNSDGGYTIGADTLLYIGQFAAEDGTITFENVYPMNLVNSAILITGEGLTESKVAEIKVNYRLGDVNNDGKINVLDTVLTAQYVAGIDITTTFIEAAAKVSVDDKINVLDTVLIAQYVAGIITEFPASK